MRLRRFTAHQEGNRYVVLGETNAAVVEGRTSYPSRVVPSLYAGRLLKSGFNSRKIGSHVVKGAWKGMPIYTLTLEERATCPQGCIHWRDCFGNKMNWSKRIAVDRNFVDLLDAELEALAKANLGGFVVRLHVLGDFVNVAYVDLWERFLACYLPLHVFGYTAHRPASPIGARILRLNEIAMDRFRVRFSNANTAAFRTITIERPGEVRDAILCPAQTGKTECCGTCALCWQSNKPIAFLRH